VGKRQTLGLVRVVSVTPAFFQKSNKERQTATAGDPRNVGVVQSVEAINPKAQTKGTLGVSPGGRVILGPGVARLESIMQGSPGARRRDARGARVGVKAMLEPWRTM
jgi:hypothetical protein